MEHLGRAPCLLLLESLLTGVPVDLLDGHVCAFPNFFILFLEELPIKPREIALLRSSKFLMELNVAVCSGLCSGANYYCGDMKK